MIVHIATKADWEAAQQSEERVYVPAGFDRDAEPRMFIHCSQPDQVAGPANEFFSGQSDLVLLWIEPGKLPAGVVYERNNDAGDLWPHIYGSIHLDAVLGVSELEPWAPGGFVLPKAPRELPSE